MFGHEKVSPQRMPSKQQQLCRAVWVKERGLILLPSRGRSQTCLCMLAGSCSLWV